jgi:hypothetical protein
MIIQAGDLHIFIDTGTYGPGAVLQRLEDGTWRDYQRDGKVVVWPVEIDSLTPGEYRLREVNTKKA